MIILTTPRLIIRDHLPGDLETHHLLYSDEKAMYYLPEIITRTPEQSRQSLEHSIAEAENPGRTCWFFRIEDKQGSHIGEIGYTVMDTTPLGKLVGMGYFLHTRHWGNGYASEALREVLRFAFEENVVYRAACGCAKENAASERVMIKCGMIKEAELKAYYWHDGRMLDRLEYRLLKNEWDSLL